MHVYFVRHGETDLNRKSVHQSPSTPLNEHGVEQARTVSESLRAVNASLLVSSTYERARQTARVISSRIDVKPKYSELFYEVVRPSSLAEVSLYSPKAIWFLVLTILFRNNPKWRYHDAENFSDVYARVQRTFTYIESLTEAHNSVIIVTHSAYMSLMVRYMCHSKHLTLYELIHTYLSLNQLDNCGVIHVEYVGPTPRGTCSWLLRT